MNSKSLIGVVAAALLTLGTPQTQAQEVTEMKEFTLEDLNFGGTNYYNMIPGNRRLTWWGDQLVRIELNECYLVDKKTGKETVLFTVDDVNKWLEATPDQAPLHALYNARFPYGDQPLVLLQFGGERCLIDFEQKKQVWHQSSADERQASSFNTTSRNTAYVSGDQLYVRPADFGKEDIQLTTDGSREIVYGRSVHRDEFGIHSGLFWSPDGMRLAFYRMDQSMVTDYPQVNLFGHIATHEPDKYPMAGELSHEVTIGVYDVATNKTLYLKAGDPEDRYFTNVAWSPDSKTIYIFELNREQNDCRLVSYDATTGDRLAELYREIDRKYVEPFHPIEFLPWDDTKFILQSQKDGYNHLYLFDTKGNELKQLTRGEWVVLNLVGFCPSRKSIIISSNECSPIQCNTWEVSVATGKRTLLDNGEGWHSPSLSGSGHHIADNYQTPTIPRNIEIADVKTRKHTAYYESPNPWEGYKIPQFTCGTLKAADGTTDLYWRMVKPADFDETKQYPTVVYVYGGPHAHNVDARWNYASRSWETYMAQKGYIIFILDNRGSENRGKAFEQATFRRLGQEEMRDQMCGVDYLKSLPYVDADRIGVHGWSFGGFMTISLMTNYPDVFKVGVAGGPVIDWKWYEVMYGERYMDSPAANPEGYAETSLLPKAKNLKGKLQIITGYNDPTVVPQHCLMFIEECIKAGTQPDFFAYPGEGHNMMGHKSVHLHERITQYFEDWLK
ncbi:MAG: DPP IV N-terminal domain-containing protein [Bacteroidaceae bacterium]|nr:DPP IV N-terminal domain-containing protein [Bacteroidaceae bacterium]